MNNSKALLAIDDTGVPSDNWKASNIAVWPDEKQMMVAREQNLDSPLLVHYPQRRNLLAMIESDEYKKSQYHRDAGLERVAIFMGSRKNF